jgi:hypothetical protein
VLVHGCDGFDQSAAVAVAALMRHCTATLEVTAIIMDCTMYHHVSHALHCTALHCTAPLHCWR